MDPIYGGPFTVEPVTESDACTGGELNVYADGVLSTEVAIATGQAVRLTFGPCNASSGDRGSAKFTWRSGGSYDGATTVADNGDGSLTLTGGTAFFSAPQDNLQIFDLTSHARAVVAVVQATE